ncbi:MAG: tetratricopeptide repeat protein, partial [Blastocatellia bacterium]|nr:tetratricopeptide repeat protein [Blastocatellia bacterium]
LAAGQYVKLIVRQRGIDVMSKVFRPNGKQLADFDSEIRRQGQENVEWVAEVEGSYRLDVISKYKQAEAGRYEIELIELRAATENDQALQEARILYTDLHRLYRAGEFDKAESQAERVLAIREKALGAEHFEVATALNFLGNICYMKGDLAKAELMGQRALAMMEKTLGPEHPYVANSLNNLGLLYTDMGNYEKAESYHLRAVALMKRTLGLEHPLLATSVDNLASLYIQKGDYLKAEPLFQQALALKEKAFGLENPQVAQTLNNLARLYKDRGDYTKAESFYHRGLTILEKSLGPKHVIIGSILFELGDLQLDLGDYAKAESFYLRALPILENGLGPEHPDVAQLLNTLATVYIKRRDYAKAESLIQRALAALEKQMEPDNPAVASAVMNLAILNRKRGDFGTAEQLYERALASSKKVFGPEHSRIADVLKEMAILNAAKGDIAQSITLLSSANDIDERNLSSALALGSERQKLVYLDTFSKGTDITLSLQSRTAPQNPQALELAFTTLLRRKARGLDAMTDTIASLRRHATPQDQELFEKLKDARSRLATLTLKDPDTDKLDAYRTRVNALKTEIEDLEGKLSSRNYEFGKYRKDRQPVVVSAVQAALPADSVLVEFGNFTPIDLKTEKSEPPRYLAYLLAPQGQPRWVDLGEAAPIDQTIRAWRKSLCNPARPDVHKLGRAVDEKLMRPVRSLIGEMTRSTGGTRHLLIAPEGSLNLIPFAALVDEEDQYLVERYTITYLTSGRDLLRLQTTEGSQSGPLVVANPEFGDPATIARRVVARSGKSRMSNKAQFDPTQVYFQPLPASRYEARAIKTIFPQAAVLEQEEATETALKQARGPQILHIATHGFFYDNALGAQEEEPTVSEPLSTIPFTLQLKATRDRESAEERVKQLAERGVDAYIIRRKVKSKGYYFRVRTGMFRNKEEAESYGSMLREKGIAVEYFIAQGNQQTAAASSGKAEPMIADLRLSRFAARIKDPLLRSGLALAGANEGKSGDDDGILTALEAADLDLTGTKLVVLSACNTGVGDVKNGEGVQGLRRALVLAGSESQIMSLWPVSDTATKELMTTFYQALQEGAGRSEGLRQVQLRIIHERKDRQHPFYWAAFIQSGEWANLEGQR